MYSQVRVSISDCKEKHNMLICENECRDISAWMCFACHGDYRILLEPATIRGYFNVVIQHRHFQRNFGPK